MAYYVLQDGFELCGWKGLPFALRYPNPHFTDFFDREDYRLVYRLDGKHDIDAESLTDSQKKLLERLVERGIAIPSDGTKTLAPWQTYKSYPAMYKNSVQWSITGRCNYKCRHCFMSAPDYRGEDLTMEQVERILDGLKECGIRCVSLTGGEALVHPHFYDILDGIAARGIVLETLYTNGELVDGHLLDELEKRKMRPAFHLSFDGAGWHDWLRGVDGAEAAVIRAFRLLRECGWQTSVSMCLHRHNIGVLKQSVDLLAREGVSHVKMNVASPTGRWKNETEHFISQDEAFEAIDAYLPQYVADGMPVSAQFCGFIDFNKESHTIMIPFQKYSGAEGADRAFACGAVKNGMYISPTGKILPCMTLGGTAIDPMFESALEKPLSEILSDSHYRDMCLAKMGDCVAHNEACRDCQYRLACGAGCRACACGETNTDYFGIDEDACRFFKGGWYERAQALVERYRDSFSPAEEARAEQRRELFLDEMEQAAAGGGDYENCRAPQAQSCPNLQSFHQEDQSCVRRLNAKN